MSLVNALPWGAGGFFPAIKVTIEIGSTVTLTDGNYTQVKPSITGEISFEIPYYGLWDVIATNPLYIGKTLTKQVDVTEVKVYPLTMLFYSLYGVKIVKAEQNPSDRVIYTDEAIGKTPMQMNFAGGYMDYGSWGDQWFFTENKPLMLNNDRTRAYYLDPMDYTKKEDGSSSDVSNDGFAGNAMAQFPVVWLKQWEDATYEYIQYCDVKLDNDFNAFSHTNADGSISPYMAYSMFGGYSASSKLRSLKGKAVAQSQTAATQISQAEANGAGWYIHTWSQRNLIQLLLTLIGKNDDTQAVFGKGNCRDASSASGLLNTGAAGSGQFWGSSANNAQVKVFHIEQFWGNQWDRVAGMINNSGNGLYAKMTPEGDGYRVTDVTGYEKLNIVMSGTSGGYISGTKMTPFGRIPAVISGSASTYVPDGGWFNNAKLCSLLAGGSAKNASAIGGAFTFDVNYEPSFTIWYYGAGVSCNILEA